MIGTAPLPQARCSLCVTIPLATWLSSSRGGRSIPFVPRDPAELGRPSLPLRAASHWVVVLNPPPYSCIITRGSDRVLSHDPNHQPPPPQPVNPPHHYVAHSYLASQRACLHNTTSGQIASRTRLKAILCGPQDLGVSELSPAPAPRPARARHIRRLLKGRCTGRSIYPRLSHVCPEQSITSSPKVPPSRFPLLKGASWSFNTLIFSSPSLVKQAGSRYYNIKPKSIHRTTHEPDYKTKQKTVHTQIKVQ
jgi:hypothetical protein